MALPYDYIFDPDATAQGPQVCMLNQVQIRFLLTVLTPYSDVSDLNWVDAAGEPVFPHDKRIAKIAETWYRLQQVVWT